ncbi:MAG: hypothetical protein M1840_006439 [Geoglossum simile]|nr:MAG: hypothetical protein M1840_006439 [Geoglossum simile]
MHSAFSYVPLRNFDDLTPRPPTPPRDSRPSDTVAAILSSSTPRSNSPSSTDSSYQTGEKTRKRVGFSPLTTSYHRLPALSGDSTSGIPLKPLPPSRDRKSSKSILKPFERPVPLHPADFSLLPGQGISPHSYANFANMLQSVVQQLAGTVRSSRLDAYIAISGTLKAYQDGTPDLEAMTKQMGLFMQFIQRDMRSTLDSGSWDTALITKSLKLLAIFFWSPQLSGALTEEFCSFVLDHAITTIEDAQVPKALTSHYTHLLVQQKFSPKVMTASRANRLITALHKDHIKGTGLTGERLGLYQKLLSQARPIMISRAAEWMEHLFSSMLSSIKEIRSRAVDFGMEAGITLGTTREVSRATSSLFNRETDGTIYAEYLGKRLSRMVAEKEDGPHAAKVWSVVVLFFRSRPHQLEHWEHIQLWLRVIQECFNSGDITIRNHANLAWNKLVYSISPDAETSEKTVRMLRIPISGPLEKKGNDKFSVNGRQMALASLCNLLYYSLSPRAPAKQLDLCWGEYVDEVLGKVFLSGVGESDQACGILAALFDGRQPKPWIVDRATQSGAITVGELPRLDSKWVRSRANRILKIVEVAFGRAPWNDNVNDEAPVQRLWLNFTKTISDAGSLEVKTSSELMEAMAHIFNMFQRIWRAGPRALGVGNKQPKDAFLRRFGFLVQTAMAHIGTISFTEKVLSLDSQQQFEAVSTPTHRSSSGSRAPRLSVSPVLHLFQFYLQPPAGIAITPFYYDMVRELLEACCNSRSSRRTRMELVKQCVQALPTPTTTLAEPTHVTAVWEVIAGLSENAMLMAAQEKALNSPQPVGQEYRDMRSVLEWGAKYYQSCHFQTWNNLFIKFVNSVNQEMGSGGVAAAIIEPLALALKSERIDYSDGIILAYGALILETTTYPRNRQALDNAQKALWGSIIGARKTPSFDPFDHLYQMINHFLVASYGNLPSIDDKHARTFLSQVSMLVEKCPLSLLSILLKRIQEGVAVWVEDADHKLTEKESEIFKTVSQLWAGICLAVQRLLRKDSFVLKTLSTLISCGLESHRKVIANATVELWNSTFGQQETLDYPPNVKNALRRLRPIVDLQLPTFPESADDEIAATPPEFSESQEEDDYATRDHIQFSSPTPAPAARKAPPRDGLNFPMRISPCSPLRSSSHRDTPEKTPDVKSTKLAPQPRLRHDDSQIQFATIDSSPIGDTGMDSQVLTDHQRDVRERQQMDAAAMFPDIRSSPKVVISTDKRHFQQRSLSPGLPSASEWAADNSSAPILPPPPRYLGDTFTGSSPASKGNYTPPSSPPVPLENHMTEQESDLSSFPIEAHEEAEFGDTDAQDLFRASAQQYLDREGADDLELGPSGEATVADGKVELQVPPANAKEHGMAGLMLDEDPGDYQQREIGTFGQEYEEISETTQSPRDEPTKPQVVQHTGIPEVPKTPPPQRRRGAVIMSPRPFTPETKSREPDLLTTAPQSPRVPREGRLVEVSGAVNNIETPPSVDPARTRPGTFRRPPTPDGDVNRRADSPTKGAAGGVTSASPIENRAAEDSEFEWQDSTEKNPSQSLKPKRKRLSLFSPRKPKRTKQDSQDDEEMGDCIIVMPSPQKSPSLPNSATRKTSGKNAKNIAKNSASLDHSSDGLNRTRKRLASESILLDDGEETPTGRKKRARRSNPTTPASSVARRRSTRLGLASVLISKPVHELSQSSSIRSDSEDIIRVEDSQVVAIALEDGRQRPKGEDSLDGEKAIETGNVCSTKNQLTSSSPDSTLLEVNPPKDASNKKANNGETKFESPMTRNLRGALASGDGEDFETAPEAPGDHKDTTAIPSSEVNLAPTKAPRSVPTAGAHDSSSQTSTERESNAASVVGRGIIGGLRKILRDIQRVMLGREEATEIHSLLDDIGHQVDGATTSP